MTRRKIVPGTVRYKRDYRWVYTSPTTYSYSTALMLAQEYYDGRKWVPYIPGLNNLETIGDRKHDHESRHRKTHHNKRR